jgi:hypothetical protein
MRLPAFSLGDAMADKSNRLFRDPDKIHTSKPPSQAELNRIGFWTAVDREAMDAQFRLAMTTAIECGAEHCATEPSTHPGTKCPVVGYQRP